MRIRALHLLSFGPFRGKSLAFANDGGVEVVFGPNEAGKSTTRRAVLGLLFGIPERSKDGHSSLDEMRVGATLVDEAGRTFEVVRRKGRKNTLLGPNETPIDENVLRGVLGGMDESTYETTYGLDHTRLRLGGAALRVGNGELGESLFSAATGLTGLHGVLVELRREADALFVPRGTQRPLNEAQRSYADAKKRAGQLATSSDKWLEVEKQIETARAELDALARERAAAAEERGTARTIAESARLRDANRARLTELEASLGEARAELDAIDAPAELLARPQAIAELQEFLGSHNKALKDRPRIAAELEATEERARLAKRDAPKHATTDLPAEAHVRKLASEAGVLRERARQIESREAEQAGVVARAAERLAALGIMRDASMLREALESAQREGNIEARLAAARENAKRERAQAETRRASLGGFEGTLEELVALAVPAADVVTAHARAAAALVEKRRAASDRKRRLDEEHAELARSLGALRAGGDVPTEEVLARARADRDAQWDALRESPKMLASGAAQFERAMRAADELADRLRREASRVTRLVELEASLAATARKLEIVAEEERALAEESEAATRAWRAVWTPSRITAGTPDDMVAWLPRHESAALAASRALDAEKAIEPLAEAVKAARETLVRALVADRELTEDVGREETLPRLEQSAKRAIAARDKVDAERSSLETARQNAERERDRIARERASFERERAHWEGQWAACTRSLGLHDDSSPEEVTAALDALATLARIDDDAEKIRRRLAGIDRDARRFADAVRAVCDACAPDLVARPPEEACAELARRIARAADQRARRETLAEQLRRIEAQTRDARAASASAEAAVATSEPASVAESRAAELDARIVDLDDRIQQKSRLLGSVETGAKQFDQSPAIEQAAEAQRQLARVRDLTERFARARLAAAAVGRLLERFRRENQGPVLARASALFAMLTLGAFEGLEVGFGESDEPVLVAVREGRRLETSALSDGTLDQLYLALRVASLERMTEGRGPLPLLLDDVLVHFDDQRAAAALSVLGELAKRTQVILFTHHARVVEIARRTISDRDGATAAGIHDLARP